MRTAAVLAGWLGLLVVSGSPSIVPGQEAPVFALNFEPCDITIERTPGRFFERSFDVIITTSANPGASGAQGWSLSLSADGVRVVDITTQGTQAAGVDDVPPGLRRKGFEKSEIADSGIDGCEGRRGAISAVVLSLIEVVTLPPAGSAAVARITVAGEAPPGVGQKSPAALYYVDGCGGSG